MDLKQKVGHLIMVEIPGKSLTDETATFVRECHPAGIALFGHNWGGPWTAAKLIADLQSVAASAGDAPLLIGIDQEGGQVAHLRYPCAEMPSNMARAAAGGAEAAGQAAEVLGLEMSRLGMNMAFAPVVDVNTNPANPVIGTRSFSDDPELVSACAVATVEALRRAGVLSMAKHFPGHGDTSVDSHVDLPVVRHGWERLRSVELAPFRAAWAAIEAGVDAVITAHVAYSGVDRSGLPATLSKRLMTNLLRGELGFRGALFSDALVMDAIAKRNSANIPPAAIAAVRAGVDCVMVLGSLASQRNCYLALLAAVEDGLISKRRLSEAVERVKDLRERVRPGTTVNAWPDMQHQRAARQIALAAITLVRDRAGLLPLAGDGHGLGVIEFASGRYAPVDGARNEPVVGSTLALLIEQSLPRAQFLALQASSPGAAELVDCFVAGCSRLVVATRSAVLDHAQAELLRRIADIAGPRPVVLAALRSPYDAGLEPRIGTVLLTYSDQPNSIAALLDVLTGSAPALGQLPVRLPEQIEPSAVPLIPAVAAQVTPPATSK